MTFSLTLVRGGLVIPGSCSLESRANLARPRLTPPGRSREVREIREFPREIRLARRETDLARVSGAARGWRETGLVTISAVENSKWPDLSEELDGIVVPDGFVDPREAYCAVFLLGPIRVFRVGQRVVGGWRRKSLELLAFLAVHPSGAAKDQILEALWPGGDPRQTQQKLWQAISFLRSRLQTSLPGGIIQKSDDLYRLDSKRVWVDAIAFTQSARSDGLAPEARLRFACDLYKGDFCEGQYYGWATPPTEGLKSLGINAARELSIHLEKCGNTEDALILLDKALSLDPYDEDLGRRMMVLEASQGRHDLVGRRFRRLRRILVADLGVEPSPDSVATFEALVFDGARGQPHSHEPGSDD